MKLHRKLSTLVVVSMLAGSLPVIAQDNDNLITTLEEHVVVETAAEEVNEADSNLTFQHENDAVAELADEAYDINVEELGQDLKGIVEMLNGGTLIDYDNYTITDQEGKYLLHQGTITTSGGAVVIDKYRQLVSPNTGNVIVDKDGNLYVEGKKLVIAQDDMITNEYEIPVKIETLGEGEFKLTGAMDDVVYYEEYLSKVDGYKNLFIRDGEIGISVTHYIDDFDNHVKNIRMGNIELQYYYLTSNGEANIGYSENDEFKYCLQDSRILCDAKYAHIQEAQVEPFNILPQLTTSAGIKAVKSKDNYIFMDHLGNIYDSDRYLSIDKDGNIYAPKSNKILVDKDGNVYGEGNEIIVDTSGNPVTDSTRILENVYKDSNKIGIGITNNRDNGEDEIMYIDIDIDEDRRSIFIHNPDTVDEYDGIQITGTNIVDNEPTHVEIDLNNGLIIVKTIEDDKTKYVYGEKVCGRSAEIRELFTLTQNNDGTLEFAVNEENAEAIEGPVTVLPPTTSSDDDDEDTSSSSSSSSSSNKTEESKEETNKEEVKEETPVANNTKEEALAKVKELSIKPSDATIKALQNNKALAMTTKPVAYPTVLTLDGTKLELKDSVLYTSDRTFLPIRAIAEALDAVVGFNAQSKVAIVSKNGTTIELPANRNVAIINGKEVVEVDSESDKVGTFIENGRTYLPIRFIAEHLGLDVEYTKGNITLKTSK